MSGIRVIVDSDGAFLNVVDAKGFTLEFDLQKVEDDSVDGETEDMVGCSNCGADTADLSKCTGCDTAEYCSVECQSDDWEAGHNGECAELIEAGRHRRRAYRRYGNYNGRGFRRGYGRGGYGYGRGYGGFGRWSALFSPYSWYRPYYYNYWKSWYPRGYGYYNPAIRTGQMPAPVLSTFDPEEVKPEDMNDKLKELRQEHSEYMKQTGMIIVPDYDSGKFRWARLQ